MALSLFYLLFAHIVYAALPMTTAGTPTPSFADNRVFAANIFQVIAAKRTQENVVFSPASIHSCLALVFLGAESETSNEMRRALQFSVTLDKSTIARDYGIFLESNFHTSHGVSEDTPQLSMANRIYVNEALQLATNFNQLAKTNFKAEAVPTKFADPPNAVKAINTWVQDQTNGKIKNLLQPSVVNADTSAVLVNAFHFKAKWRTAFSKSSTSKANFMVSAEQTVPVDMMYGSERFKYGVFPNLDATVLEMPYKNTNIAMLILLPNKVDGLLKLEQKLATEDLNQIAEKLSMESVDVMLPKFRIEFDIDLKEPLKALGILTVFSDSADLSGLFDESMPQKVDVVKHKAFLDVNEAGSEAAAATFIKIEPMSLNLQQKHFVADHPFVFAIRNNEVVYLVGHVAKF